MYKDLNFNNDGLLSKEAINLLDSGCLSFISAKLEANMEDRITKDLIASAIDGSLQGILASLPTPLIC